MPHELEESSPREKIANGPFPKRYALCSSHTCSQSKMHPVPHKAAKISRGEGVQGGNRRNEESMR